MRIQIGPDQRSEIDTGDQYFADPTALELAQDCFQNRNPPTGSNGLGKTVV